MAIMAEQPLIELEPVAESESSACPPFPLFGEDDGGGDGGHEHAEAPLGEALELPTVDLEAPGEALPAACRRLGIFRLANHGVPAELSARLFALARDLLGRTPFPDKQAQPGYFWSAPGAERLRPRDVNWIEGYHVHLAQDRPIVVGPTPPPPGAPAALGDLLAEYGDHMARVARRLFDALAAALGLDAGRTASYLDEHAGYLRVHRYPRCPEPGHHGIVAHTDSTTLSIISGGGGGLQVLHGGAWRDVAPAGRGGTDDTLLVNLGDMAQAISADAYRSIPHRVVASRGGGDGDGDGERLSLCYFAFPRDDAVVSCDGSRYRPFTVPEFRAQVQADLKATGAKVGLERFLRH